MIRLVSGFYEIGVEKMSLETSFLTENQKDGLQEIYLKRLLNNYLIKNPTERRDIEESIIDKLSSLRHESMYWVERSIHDGLVLSMNENSEDYQTCEILNVIRHDMQVLMDSWVQSKSIARFEKRFNCHEV